MAKFEHYKVEILIEEGSDLDKRLRAYCMAENGKVTAGGMEDALSYAVRLGVYGHISQLRCSDYKCHQEHPTG